MPRRKQVKLSMLDLSFDPEPTRSAAVDAAIRQSLANSIATLMTEITHSGIEVKGDVCAWREHLLRHAAPARLWACYHDLVQAILRLDEAAVPSIAAELLSALPAPIPLPGSVVTLSRDSLGDTDLPRYLTVIDNDVERPLYLLPVAREEVKRIEVLAIAARDLLAETAPALLDEIDTVGHEIVLATSCEPLAFGGAATVFLWGAVILNPARVPDRVTLVESLAHEAAHALLFGLTLGVDLTTNDPSERYGSPLRSDLRPIEGIVHATYVLARMIYALDAIGASRRLTAGERELIERKVDHNLKSYAVGLQTVEAHARFTPAGAAIFDACRRTMERRGVRHSRTGI